MDGGWGWPRRWLIRVRGPEDSQRGVPPPSARLVGIGLWRSWVGLEPGRSNFSKSQRTKMRSVMPGDKGANATKQVSQLCGPGEQSAGPEVEERLPGMEGAGGTERGNQLCGQNGASVEVGLERGVRIGPCERSAVAEVKEQLRRGQGANATERQRKLSGRYCVSVWGWVETAHSNCQDALGNAKIPTNGSKRCY
jgi:hypothetical protein